MEQDRIVPKGLVWVLGVVLVILAGLYAIDKAMVLAQRAKDNSKPQNTISISAEGKVQAVPDLAMVNLTITSQGANAKATSDENTKKINTVIDLVKGEGVDKKDIVTSGPNIYPRYDYTKGTNEIIGYTADQTVTIKVRGIDKSTDKVSTIIAKATDNGVNQLQGVSYSFDDPDNLREQAREQAIAKAKEKAQALAKSSELKLGKIVSVSESGYNPGPIPMYDSYAGKSVAPAPAMEAARPTLEPGTQDITATMTVTFEVK